MMFSIIIPVYNVEKYLTQCVESVLNQTCQDFELILVDDGSTDRSGAMCDEYERKYPEKIIAIHQENARQLAARVNGLKRAKGEYVYFADADDFLREDLLLQVKAVIDARKVDIIEFTYLHVDEKGIPKQNCNIHRFREGSLTWDDFLHRYVIKEWLDALWTFIGKRELFDVRIAQNPAYHIVNGEDVVQRIYALMQAKSFYYIDVPLYCHRKNPASVRNTYQKDRYRRLNGTYTLLWTVLKQSGLDTEENLEQFFIRQLYHISNDVLAVSISGRRPAEKKEVWQEIASYELVREAEQYLKYMHWCVRIVMKPFYKGQYRVSQCFAIPYRIYWHLSVKYKIDGRKLLSKNRRLRL